MAKTETSRPWSAVVLAAGQGTRMRSVRPKVLHRLLGKALIEHVADVLTRLPLSRIVVVLGHGGDAVRDVLRPWPVSFAVQEEQLGTAHAVRCAKNALDDVEGDVLVLCGDTPLFQAHALRAFMEDHRVSGRVLSVLSAVVHDPTGYGRIVREGDADALSRIVEEKDASAEERKICEVNAGVYAADAKFLFRALEQVRRENVQREYYLTDIVGIAVGDGLLMEALPAASADEALGVNSREELARAEEVLLKRMRRFWMEQGVTFELAGTVYIEPSVELSRDVVVGPYVMLSGKTKVGPGAVIGPYSLLYDAQVSEGSVVAPYTYLVGQVGSAGD